MSHTLITSRRWSESVCLSCASISLSLFSLMFLQGVHIVCRSWETGKRLVTKKAATRPRTVVNVSASTIATHKSRPLGSQRAKLQSHNPFFEQNIPICLRKNQFPKICISNFQEALVFIYYTTISFIHVSKDFLRRINFQKTVSYLLHFYILPVNIYFYLFNYFCDAVTQLWKRVIAEHIIQTRRFYHF